MDPRARVEKRVVYPVSRAEVWAAITRPAELSRWFGAEVVSLDLRPAGRIVVRDADGSSRRALIETVDAPHRLAFRWLPAPAGAPEGALRPRTGTGTGPGSSVEYVLEEVPGGTALTVIETPTLAVGELIPWVGPVVIAGPSSDPVGAPPRIMALSR